MIETRIEISRKSDSYDIFLSRVPLPERLLPLMTLDYERRSTQLAAG